MSEEEAEEESGYVVEWPLWGLELSGFENESKPITRLHDSLLYQPTWAQWEEMEQRDVVDEYIGASVWSEALGLPGHAPGLTCLLRLSRDTPEGPVPSLAEQHQVAREVVAALRLYGGGGFIDPDETGMYVTEPSGLVVRRVHAFRCAPYRWPPDEPFVVTPDDLPMLEALQSWVHVLFTEPQHTNAAIALENLVLSHGFTTSPAEVALHRFIALEAFLGPVSGEVRGSSFAIRLSNAAAAEDNQVIAWAANAVELRNRIAHSTHDTVVTPEDLDTLDELVHSVVVAYVNHIADSAPSGSTLRSFNDALGRGPIGQETG